MKKIADMTLTELQDYALKIEEEKTTLQASLDAKEQELTELTETNLLLQKRNNELFVRVEQGVKNTTQQEEDPEPESCEDFALKNIKEIMK